MTFPTMRAHLDKLRASTERKRERCAAIRQADRLPTPERTLGPVTGGPSVKIHPALAQRAMKLKRDREYRLWVLARSLPGAGSGRVRVADIVALIEQEDINGLSPGTLRRLLSSGAGVFWKVCVQDGDKVLYLAGLAAVCGALGVVKLSYLPVFLPTRWARTLGGFRAACYASAFPESEWSNPISRAVLEKLTGKTARTQQRYDAALSAKLSKRENAKIVNGKPKHGEELPPGVYVDKRRTANGDEFILLQRLPNSYQIEFARGRRGMMRRVNQRLRYSLQFVGREKRDKLFYRNEADVNRRLECNKPDDFFYRLKTVKKWPRLPGDGKPGKTPKPIILPCKTRGGTVLWENVQKVGGRVLFG